LLKFNNSLWFFPLLKLDISFPKLILTGLY
jgi:hypothetical protein